MVGIHLWDLNFIELLCLLLYGICYHIGTAKVFDPSGSSGCKNEVLNFLRDHSIRRFYWKNVSKTSILHEMEDPEFEDPGLKGPREME